VSSNPLVKRLAIVFGEPKTEDPAAFLGEYAHAFKGTPKDILDVAADVIIKQRKYRNWPTVAECLEAIDAAKKQIVAKGKILEPIKNFDEWWDGICRRIDTAPSRDEVHDLLNEARPYHLARWMAEWRMSALVEKAERRCGELYGKGIVGEAAE
jgi:hypothetical protein